MNKMKHDEKVEFEDLIEFLNKLTQHKDNMPDYLPMNFYIDLFETLLFACKQSQIGGGLQISTAKDTIELKVKRLHTMAVHLFHLLVKLNDDILKAFDVSKRNMDTLNLTKLMVDGDLLE